MLVWRAHAAPWPCPTFAVPGQVAKRDQQVATVDVATGDGVLVLEEVQLGEDTRRP
jgi:hypothetical protein